LQIHRMYLLSVPPTPFFPLTPQCSGFYPSSHPLSQLQTQHTHSSLPTSRTLDQLPSRPVALSNLPRGAKVTYFAPGGGRDQSNATSLDTFMTLRSFRLGAKRGSDRTGKNSNGPERKKGTQWNPQTDA